jgi:hypothetical protein
MFKDLQQQHVWLWPATLTFPLKSSARSGWRSTAYSNQHTEFLSPDRQYRETLSHGAGNSTAKQMNDWIEEVCSLTFTSCEGYNTPQLHQVMTHDMHIQSHQEKKWGCYFSDVSSFKQQGLRGEREILLIKAWFPVASKWSCFNFRTSCTYSISQSTVYGATDS